MSSADPGRPIRAGLGAIALAGAALAAALALAHVLLRGRVLATWEGREALAPLYAFREPLARPQALVFAAAAALLAVLAPRLADPERTSRRNFGAVLAAAAVLLPLALFLVRSDPVQLGSQLEIYRNEEFLHDARRIADLPRFLEGYADLMPSLSLHGQHFPPGHAVLLWAVAQVTGASAVPAGLAGLVALALGAAGVVLGWRLLGEFAVERASRQGALLLLAAPALLDFTCTSMDAVFLFFATLAGWLALRAVRLESPARAWLAGAALLAATFFSFSALPVGLWILLVAVLRGRSALRRPPRRTGALLAHTLAGFAGSALLLFAATGFPIWTVFLRARASNQELMRNAAGANPSSLWALFSLGNATAFLAGAGLGLVAAFACGLRRGRAAAQPVAWATLLALIAMAGGGIYFLETERIWLFALPWLAAGAVAAGPFDDRSLRTLLAAGFAQALLAEILLFTLW